MLTHLEAPGGRHPGDEPQATAPAPRFLNRVAPRDCSLPPTTTTTIDFLVVLARLDYFASLVSEIVRQPGLSMAAPSVAPVAPSHGATGSSPDMSPASSALNLRADRREDRVANSDVCAPSALPGTNAELLPATPLRNQVSFLQSAGPPPPPPHIPWAQHEIELARAQLSKYTLTPDELAQQGVVSNLLDLLDPSMEGFGLVSGMGWVWTSATGSGEVGWPSAMVLSCAMFEGTVQAVCLLDVWTREVVYEACIQAGAESSCKPQSLDYVRANLARFITAETYLVGPDVCTILHTLRIAHPRVLRMPDPAMVARLDRALAALSGCEVHGRIYEPFGAGGRAGSADLEEEACEWARVLNALMWFDATFGSELVD